MTMPLVVTSIRKVVNIAALAALAAATLLTTTPAEARRISCLAKYQGCQVRCASNGGLASAGWYACVNRTCNPQFDYCSRFQ